MPLQSLHSRRKVRFVSFEPGSSGLPFQAETMNLTGSTALEIDRLCVFPTTSDKEIPQPGACRLSKNRVRSAGCIPATAQCPARSQAGAVDSPEAHRFPSSTVRPEVYKGRAAGVGAVYRLPGQALKHASSTTGIIEAARMSKLPAGDWEG